MILFPRFLRESSSKLLSTVGVCAIAMAAAGCSLLPQPKADPTRYYVLTGALPETAALNAAGGLVIGLKRIEIAAYLNGKDMVVRGASNEISYSRYSRWAEPPATSIGRVLTARLDASPRVGRVYVQPFPLDVERDYDVAVRVLRCEGERKTSGGTVAGFVAEVEVTEAKPGGAVVARKTFTAPEAKWDGQDFGQLARALSKSVRILAEETVSSLPEKK